MSGPTVLRSLRAARERFAAAGIASADLDAVLLLGRVLQAPKHVVRTSPDRVLGAGEERAFAAFVEERVRRRPLSQILGSAEFRSRAFAVDESVLSPRPETEMLVDAALEAAAAARAAGRRPVIGEIGAGSGCVCVSIAAEAPDALVVASEVSGAALLVAAANAHRHGATERLRLLRGELAGPLARFAPFDAIVSNPPYIRRSEAGELPPEVLWEPSCALFCDGEPAAFYGRIAGEAAPLLREDGLLAMELPGDDPAAILAAVRAAARCRSVRVDPDLAGRPRLVSARARRSDAVREDGEPVAGE